MKVKTDKRLEAFETVQLVELKNWNESNIF